jgi:hypothetical protein
MIKLARDEARCQLNFESFYYEREGNAILVVVRRAAAAGVVKCKEGCKKLIKIEKWREFYKVVQ